MDKGCVWVYELQPMFSAVVECLAVQTHEWKT